MPASGKANRTFLYKSAFSFAVMFFASLAAVGQTQRAASSAQVPVPAFDVVSIKPNKSDSGGMSMGGGANRFTGTNLTIIDLVGTSYNLTSDDLIFGLPGWARSAHFDLDAKIVSPDKRQMDSLTPDQRRAMIQAILKDRFHFQAHLQTKILPVYDLVLAKGGAKFTGASEANTEAAADVVKRNLAHGGMMVGNGELIAGDTPVSRLAASLTGAVGRTVIDKTGLTGTYNLELKWTPEHGAPASADSGQADPQSGPSIFTAVEEQLGLKLQSSKGPVQTLVVDHVEMPTEN